MITAGFPSGRLPPGQPQDLTSRPFIGSNQLRDKGRLGVTLSLSSLQLLLSLLSQEAQAQHYQRWGSFTFFFHYNSEYLLRIIKENTRNYTLKKKKTDRTFLVVQWLDFLIPLKETQVQSLGSRDGLRSHMLCSVVKTIKPLINPITITKSEEKKMFY